METKMTQVSGGPASVLEFLHGEHVTDAGVSMHVRSGHCSSVVCLKFGERLKLTDGSSPFSQHSLAQLIGTLSEIHDAM